MIRRIPKYLLLAITALLLSYAAYFYLDEIRSVRFDWIRLSYETHMTLMGAAMFFWAALLFVYVAHVYSIRAEMSALRQMMWIIALAITGPVAMSVYWFAHIRPEGMPPNNSFKPKPLRGSA